MTSSTTRSFVDDLSSAVQANPVPAALIGMGALWMLMGGGRTTAAAALLANGASRAADSLAPAGDTVRNGAGRIGETLSEYAYAATDAVGQALGTAGEAVTDAAGRLTSTASEAGKQLTSQSASVRSSASGLAGSVQGNLTETFERQPLLVGVLGLAIGAVIASAFPRTRMEAEMVGEQAGAIKQKVGEFVSDQAENLGEVASRTIEAVKDEAKTQGLTPAALKEGVAAVREKATKAASGVAAPARARVEASLASLSGTSTHIRRYQPRDRSVSGVSGIGTARLPPSERPVPPVRAFRFFAHRPR